MNAGNLKPTAITLSNYGTAVCSHTRRDSFRDLVVRIILSCILNFQKNYFTLVLLFHWQSIASFSLQDIVTSLGHTKFFKSIVVHNSCEIQDQI